jgi:hypothetical protein
VDRLAIGEQHDPEEAVPHLWNVRPAADPAIGLDRFPDRPFDRVLDPLVGDHGGTVTPRAALWELMIGVAILGYGVAHVYFDSPWTVVFVTLAIGLVGGMGRLYDLRRQHRSSSS